MAYACSVLKLGYVLGGKPSSSESLSATLLWDREVSPAVCVLQADLFSHLTLLFFEMGSVHNEALRFLRKDWESGLQRCS